MSSQHGQPGAPNTGRILEYWLGGPHYFPIDAKAGDGFAALYPGFPAFFKASRAFIGRATRYIREQGVEQFVVIGTGIPNSYNVHEVVPDARVLYTDFDADNIRLGCEILADVPHVGYTYFDAGDVSTYDFGAETEVLGPLKQLGVIACGVAGFIVDDRLLQLFDWFHKRAPRGSYLAFDFDTPELGRIPQVVDILSSSGPYFPRTVSNFEPLLGAWTPTVDGIVGVHEWRNPSPEDVPPLFRGGVARH